MTENLATPDVIDAEFSVEEVASTAITLVPTGNETPRDAVTRALATVKAINTLIDKTFIEGVHYGKIPGVDRKILFLPGLEYAMSLLQLRDEYIEVSVVRNFDHQNPFFYYELECRLYTIGTNVEIGRGVGACNSRERIFMRSSKPKCPVCDKETINRSKFPPKNSTDKTPGWYCHSKAGGCGAEFPYNEPSLQNYVSGSVFDAQLVWDNINNIVKKAKKRALGDAIKRVAMLSERFTVDLDDHMVYDDAEIGSESPAPKKTEPPATPSTGGGEKPAQNKVTQFPDSAKQAAKPAGEPTAKAWHENAETIKKLLGDCRAKGWIEGDTLGKLKASFASLVGKEISSFETDDKAFNAAELAVTKVAAKASEAAVPQQEAKTDAWDTLDAIQEIVDWSKKHGYGDNEPALLRLLGIPDWKAFDNGRQACEEIAKVAADKKAAEPIDDKLSEEALEELYAWAEASFDFSEEKLNENIDLSKFQTVGVAKTMIKAKAKEGKWHVVVEKVTYAVKTVDNTEKKYLSFQTVLGEMRYYPGRTEFAMLVGEEYANAGDILNLPANKSKDIEPLLLTWKAAENYFQVVDAMPLLERELA